MGASPSPNFALAFACFTPQTSARGAAAFGGEDTGMDAAVPAQGLQLLGTTACPAHEGVATWLHAQLVPETPESSCVVISSRLANDPRSL